MFPGIKVQLCYCISHCATAFSFTLLKIAWKKFSSWNNISNNNVRHNFAILLATTIYLCISMDVVYLEKEVGSISYINWSYSANTGGQIYVDSM